MHELSELGEGKGVRFAEKCFLLRINFTLPHKHGRSVASRPLRSSSQAEQHMWEKAPNLRTETYVHTATHTSIHLWLLDGSYVLIVLRIVY